MDLGLDDLLNIDFTKSEPVSAPPPQKEKPVVKSDNPLDSILSLYNAPAEVAKVIIVNFYCEFRNLRLVIAIMKQVSLDDLNTHSDKNFDVAVDGPPIVSDSKLDELFSSFPSNEQAKSSEDDEKQKLINDKREAMELIGFKITLTFLEKILVVFKNNTLSEGKWMGHIGIEFGGAIDKEDGEGVLLNANFSGSGSIWNNPQVLMKNNNPNVKINDSKKESKNNSPNS